MAAALHSPHQVPTEVRDVTPGEAWAAPAREHFFQIHWQDRADFNRTDLVAQAGFTGDQIKDGAVIRWAEDVLERCRDEAPEGWCPLLCTEDAPQFVRAAGPGRLLSDEAAPE